MSVFNIKEDESIIWQQALEFREGRYWKRIHSLTNEHVERIQFIPLEDNSASWDMKPQLLDPTYSQKVTGFKSNFKKIQKYQSNVSDRPPWSNIGGIEPNCLVELTREDGSRWIAHIGALLAILLPSNIALLNLLLSPFRGIAIGRIYADGQCLLLISHLDGKGGFKLDIQHAACIAFWTATEARLSFLNNCANAIRDAAALPVPVSFLEIDKLLFIKGLLNSDTGTTWVKTMTVKFNKYDPRWPIPLQKTSVISGLGRKTLRGFVFDRNSDHGTSDAQVHSSLCRPMSDEECHATISRVSATRQN